MSNVAKSLSVLVMVAASSVALAGPRPVNWELTPELRSKVLIREGSVVHSVVVDPLDCVQFSRGKIVNLSYEVDGKAYTLNAKSTNWMEQLGTMACMVPLTFGNTLALLTMPPEKDEETNPTFIDMPNSNLKVSPYPTYSKLRDSEVPSPMMTKFLEADVETKLYYHLFTCLNPNYGGTVLIEQAGKMERHSLPEARKDARVAELIGRACIGHVMPYRMLEDMSPTEKAVVGNAIKEISAKMGAR